MNGRQVFNFALLKVPAHLHELLNESDLKADDIDAFCIHQGNAAIVDAVARRFEEAPVDKFIKDMVETGNTVSSSIPLLLEKHVMDATWRSAWPSAALAWACRGARRFSIVRDALAAVQKNADDPTIIGVFLRPLPVGASLLAKNLRTPRAS